MNKFIIIVPFYNVESWILNNLNSILAQTYKNYEVYYTDDISTDSSYEVLTEEAPLQINIHRNTKKALALKNIYDSILRANPNDEDIIVTLDGDDWFARKDTLELLNDYYSDDTLMTYGTYIDYPTGRVPHNVFKYSDDIINNSSYRQAPWQASHLRTFKYKLWKKINVEDLKDSNGSFYEMAWDLAFMFPMLEMAGHRAKYVKEKVYCYNVTNPINDHKVDHAKQLRLDREIRRKRKYSYFDSMSKQKQIASQDPLRFFNFNRFDIAAKTFYVRNKQKNSKSKFYEEIYIRHLEVWNNFQEKFPPKATKEEFLQSFDYLIDDIQKNNFNPSYGKIPTFNDSAINGSHRLAACISLNRLVETELASLSEGQYTCDYKYFKNKTNFVSSGLSDLYTDEMALEFCRNKDNLFTITLFPSHDCSIQLLIETISQNYGIIYNKEVELTELGKFNYIHNLYYGESWIGSKESGFSGVKEKSSLCFTRGNKITVLLIEEDDVNNLIDLKLRLREICKVGKHSIHINDTQNETWRIAASVYNENSIHNLNNKKISLTDNFDFYYRKYKEFIAKTSDSEDYCVDASAVLSAYGLRDCRDLDFLHLLDRPSVDHKIDCHNHHALHYSVPKDEIIYNPKNHFYFFGIKFAALQVIRDMKVKRNEPKDKIDVKLIDGVL
jgi:glycosyltransferase involved in cell wall biosynthesis